MRIWSWQHVSVIHCWVKPSLLLSSFTCNVKTRVLSKLYLSVKNYLIYLQSLESNKSAIIKAIKSECRAQGKEEEEEMDRCQRGAAALANPFVKLAPPCHVSRMQHTSYMLRRQFQWCGDVSNWMQILYILVGTYWWKNCTLFVERKIWGMRMCVAAVHGDYLYIEKLSVLVGVLTANWKHPLLKATYTRPEITSVGNVDFSPGLAETKRDQKN